MSDQTLKFVFIHREKPARLAIFTDSFVRASVILAAIHPDAEDWLIEDERGEICEELSKAIEQTNDELIIHIPDADKRDHQAATPSEIPPGT